MKRIILFTMLVYAVCGLSVTASYAQLTQAQMDPGCNVDVMNLLVDQANAIRVRDRAYEREILNREESTLYLTCFDQALALSARLGYIFSDNINPDPPPANTVAFTDPIAYPDWGATHSLAVDMDTVISPELDGYLGNKVPAPANFNFLPPWTTPNALTQLVNTITPLLNNIKNFQAGQDKTNVDAYIAMVKQIEALVNSFPNIAWDKLGDAETQYGDLIKQLADLITKVDTDRKANMGNWLGQIQKAITQTTTMDCTKMDDMWDTYNANSQFYPPEGTTYYPMTPYYSLMDFLNVPASPPATQDFVQQLGFGNNPAILKQALNDLTKGPLAGPGNSAIWPGLPVIVPGATALDIIQKM